MRPASVATLLGSCALACHSAGTQSTPEPVARKSSAGSASPSAPAATLATSSAAQRAEYSAELAALLAQSGYQGVVAVTSSRGVLTSDLRRAAAPEHPASTFKIVNSLVALETAVAPTTALRIPWDGVTRQIADWNRDLDMTTAFRVSAVPYYQELARRIGHARMSEWVTRLNYGNRDISGGIDRFWLNGALRISPIEQLRFLAALREHELPVRASTRTQVIDLMRLSEGPCYELFGKTGWVQPHTPAERGWFVGWGVARGSQTRVAYVAVLLDAPADKQDWLPARRIVAEQALSVTLECR